ncbi:MlaC/ttg2D family ABC transporter substrate-binding protein [Fodinibius sediminis]|uniref:Phospholipid transport system substrate-binding protein n=1 Tax=Fodinibius sediminis TaxID=1214077 RepID=A0A521B704_9BACT|nr:ABC transporter substrate-binding protein [Fodinibius sediminis]SMO42878.1 phospholipid transport system substrate-binding protein [Fodinibius sediminis]
MIRFKKTFLVLLFSLSGLLFFQSAQAWAQNDEEAIRELLEQRDDEIKELMGSKGTEYTQEQREKLKNIINGIIDYRAMARYALEDTYNELSEDERDEFVDLFSTIIRDQSLNKLDIYRAKVKYEEISVDGSEAEVRTIAQLENVRTPVGYKMKYTDDSEWVVTDMIIDDVSTADSYQRQFQKIIRQKGYDSLLETLRKRAAR